jgi:hypothetical protein
MLMIQTQLGNDTRRMVTWLPHDRRVKVGSVISLDADERKWEVLDQSEKIDSASITRGWSVGGLA